MTIREKLQEHIKNNGLKKSFVAESIGISPSKLSCYLHGRLTSVDDTENKIKDYLDRQDQN